MAAVDVDRRTSSTSTSTRLPALWVWPARLLWLICTSLIVYGLIANGIVYAQNWLHGGVLTDTVKELGLPLGVFYPVETACAGLTVLAYFGAGLYIGLRRNDDWLTLDTSVFMMSYALYIVMRQYQLRAVPLPLEIVLDSLAFWPWFIFISHFPDGKPQPRWIMIFFAAATAYVVGMDILYAPHIFSYPQWHLVIRESALNFIALGAQIYRYFKVASSTQRQQTKWVLVAFAFGVIGDTVLSFGGFQAGAGLTAFLILRPVSAAMTVFGLACFMAAVLRYGLWDIDFVINRSLVYGGLTVLLGLVFTGMFFATHRLLELLLGGQQDLLSAGLSGVVVVVAFSPARSALRRFVDRRFYHIEIDYRNVRQGGQTPAPGVKTGDTATSFGQYKGLRLLARGGMGEVYRGEHPTLNCPIALKILPEHAAGSEQAQKRFLREAQTLARLKHPNIIVLHDVGEFEGKPFLVMEYIDGPDLSDLIEQRGGLPINEAIAIFEDIAAALDYAHTQGIVHRDIKPSNVMIDRHATSGGGKSQRAVLMDFGIAKSYAAATQLTQTGMVGTLDYISPEQIQGASEVDARADIYSLGALAFQTLTGRLPFVYNNPGALLMAHLMQPAPDPREVNTSIPRDAALAVMRAMSKKPEQRYGSAAEFMGAMAG